MPSDISLVQVLVAPPPLNKLDLEGKPTRNLSASPLLHQPAERAHLPHRRKEWGRLGKGEWCTSRVEIINK